MPPKKKATAKKKTAYVSKKQKQAIAEKQLSLLSELAITFRFKKNFQEGDHQQQDVIGGAADNETINLPYDLLGVCLQFLPAYPFLFTYQRVSKAFSAIIVHRVLPAVTTLDLLDCHPLRMYMLEGVRHKQPTRAQPVTTSCAQDDNEEMQLLENNDDKKKDAAEDASVSTAAIISSGDGDDNDDDESSANAKIKANNFYWKKFACPSHKLKSNRGALLPISPSIYKKMNQALPNVKHLIVTQEMTSYHDIFAKSEMLTVLAQARENIAHVWNPQYTVKGIKTINLINYRITANNHDDMNEVALSDKSNFLKWSICDIELLDLINYCYCSPVKECVEFTVQGKGFWSHRSIDAPTSLKQMVVEEKKCNLNMYDPNSVMQYMRFLVSTLLFFGQHYVLQLLFA